MAKAIVSQARLKELLHYDPATGFFAWRISRRGHTKAGDQAGAVFGGRYVQIKIDGIQYLGHRLAWLYVIGRWPSATVDHRDHCKSNNAWSNLREATASENSQNKIKATVNSASGLLGVSLRNGVKRVSAQIKINGKQIHIGTFGTPEEAHAAYVAAKRKLHPFGNL